VFNVCSVPNGASTNTDYIENCWKYLEGKTFVICADNDSKGYVLQNELPARLGRHNCKFVTYPDDCKDLNDVLLKHGKEKVKEIISTAKPPPIEGYITATELDEKINTLYNHGYPELIKCGYDQIDNLVSFMPGQWTLITGGAKSGKSEVLDSICLGLATQGKRIAYYSFENRPYEYHFEKLIGKYTGLRPRKELLSWMQFEHAKKFIGSHICWIDTPKIDIKSMLEQAAIYVKQKGINYIVIDPYNKLENNKPAGMNETEYINEILGEISAFCIEYWVHVFLVAHPTKPVRTKDNDFRKFTLYDVSGSANFFNQLYNGIVIQKPEKEEELSKFHRIFDVQAVRFYWCGQPGKTDLIWKPDEGGRYWSYKSEQQQVRAPF
jgi:twinkle protein